MNRVCSIHNEYCPDGSCRWCVAPAVTLATADEVFVFGGGPIYGPHDQHMTDLNDGHGSLE